VAVFSVEMPAPQIALRMIVAEHERTSKMGKPKISTHDVRNGRLTSDQWKYFAEAAANFEDTPIYIDDTPDLTPMDLRSKCRRIKASHGLDLVIVDYLQLMETGLRPESRVQEITYISRWLKKLAREMKVPVLALAQLSRSPEQRKDRRPMLSDLRESGAIEQDADVVIFLYRDDYYNENSDKENVAEINVAKQRNGPQEVIEAYFDKETTLFKDLAYKTFGPDGRA
jgi:replicative DNA helicase